LTSATARGTPGIPRWPACFGNRSTRLAVKLRLNDERQASHLDD
jgi:hypothetical protein